MWKKALSLILVVSLGTTLILVASCSESDDPSDPVVVQDIEVSGKVVKGPVAGALVQIWSMGNDGDPGSLVVDGITTDSEGRWDAVLPGGQSGNLFLVTATGGSYPDEGLGAEVVIPSLSRMMGYLDTDRPAVVAITPFTHMLYLQVRGIVASTPIALCWNNALETIMADNAMGFDPTMVLPSTAAEASSNAKLYMALIGGLSRMVAEDSTYSDLTGINQFVKTLAVAEDLKDGRLDGKNDGDEPISVPLETSGTVFLPELDGTGMDALPGYANDYVADEAGLQGTVVPPGMYFDQVLPESPPCSELEDLRIQARAKLEDSLYTSLNGPDVEEPNDIDFSMATFLYRSVLDCEPSDLDARLSLAILELVDLSRDPEINDAFDQWEAYLDEFTPFELDPTGAALGIPAGFTTGSDGIELPLGTIRRSVLPFLDLNKAVAPPQIASVQTIFRDKVIPQISECIEHMDEVIADPSFTFDISPRMQGDLREETREADFTDFLALRAALEALEAGMRIAISLNVNLNEYTGAALVAGLDQGSGHLATLVADGEAQMARAGQLLTAALEDMDQAIDELFAETDDQTDDLLKVGPGEIHAEDLLEFQDEELVMMIESMAGPMTRAYDWDSSSNTPPTSLTVDMNSFFNDPIDDFKALLPSYTVSLDTVPYDENWSWREFQETFTLDVPEAGHYSVYCDYSIYINGPSWIDCALPDWMESTVGAFIEDRVEGMLENPDWAGNYYLSFGMSRNLEAGTQDITLSFYESYSLAESWVEVAVGTFAADTFEQWLADCPDPSMGGVFPEVTDAGELTSAFGMNPETWTKRFRLDWADQGFEFEYVSGSLLAGKQGSD